MIKKSAAVEHHILDNDIDIGLIENQPEHPDIIALPFMEDFLQAIVAPDHPLAECSEITLEQLAEYPFLMREKGSAGREIPGRLLCSPADCCASSLGELQYAGHRPRRCRGTGRGSPPPAFWSKKTSRNTL